jgi:hypothetical protein
LQPAYFALEPREDLGRSLREPVLGSVNLEPEPSFKERQLAARRASRRGALLVPEPRLSHAFGPVDLQAHRLLGLAETALHGLDRALDVVACTSRDLYREVLTVPTSGRGPLAGNSVCGSRLAPGRAVLLA